MNLVLRIQWIHMLLKLQRSLEILSSTLLFYRWVSKTVRLREAKVSYSHGQAALAEHGLECRTSDFYSGVFLLKYKLDI